MSKETSKDDLLNEANTGSKNIGPRVVLAVTGASGSIYAQRMLEELIDRVPRIYLIFTSTAKKVIQHELSNYECSKGISLRDLASGKKLQKEFSDIIRVFDVDDFFAPIASGSSAATHMIVLPCSMGTMGRIAGAMSSNLVERVADVMLKQKRALVLCPRETPLNLIHLKSMLTLSEAGAFILPPMPGFYHMPKTMLDLVDFVVGRSLECLQLEHKLYKKWNSRMI